MKSIQDIEKENGLRPNLHKGDVFLDSEQRFVDLYLSTIGIDDIKSEYDSDAVMNGDMLKWITQTQKKLKVYKTVCDKIANARLSGLYSTIEKNKKGKKPTISKLINELDDVNIASKFNPTALLELVNGSKFSPIYTRSGLKNWLKQTDGLLSEMITNGAPLTRTMVLELQNACADHVTWLSDFTIDS